MMIFAKTKSPDKKIQESSLTQIILENYKFFKFK